MHAIVGSIVYCNLVSVVYVTHTLILCLKAHRTLEAFHNVVLA